MWRSLGSILLFLFVASIVLACEAVTHANDYGTSTSTVDNNACGTGTLLCNGNCVARDANNCSACGVGCAPGQVCSNGDCGSGCTGGTTRCGDLCVDLTSDPANCGRCGGPPDAGACPICQNSECRSTCLGGKYCPKPKKCVDTSSDPQNCGDCDHACPSGQFCSGGNCTGSCGSNQQACGQSCVDVQTDPNNCLMCGTICASPGPNGVPVCVGGSCRVSCNPPVANQAFTVCTNVTGTGGVTDTTYTCADLQVDPDNCGRCGNKCQTLCHQGACLN
jgi:hypothetical protein